MYHIELRQFPHNVCRFNLSGPELGALVTPWVSEQFVEVGERKWRTDQARLTILEGPHLGVEQLTMGRGWRAAERESEDVTDRLLGEAKQALAGQSPARPAALADPLTPGVLADLRSVASLLGEDSAALLEAWRLVAARASGLAPSESLALAERELRAASDGPAG
jgi:hypothetical protein